MTRFPGSGEPNVNAKVPLDSVVTIVAGGHGSAGVPVFEHGGGVIGINVVEPM